ncbi:hypothetical protein [Leptospira noguchii]|uniref:hypothetical protein n=1 Tax=Leptospira noguchii TaxID=28182 RepID=UPI001FB582C2|nr:hypothetical protein [Leptospira noguchii]UOG29962.1 hypothetical protein MAL06_15215 [Leptospira noguchii]
MFPVCNLLTRAESPAGCLWQAGSPRFSYVELTLNRIHILRKIVRTNSYRKFYIKRTDKFLN